MNGIGALSGSASGSARDGVELGHRRQPRIGVLGGDPRQRQHADEMHDAAQHARRAMMVNSKRIMGSPPS